MTKDAWLTEFSIELQRLRPHLTLRPAHTIAAHEWVRSKDLDPAEAAKRYDAEHPAKQ